MGEPFFEAGHVCQLHGALAVTERQQRPLMWLWNGSGVADATYLRAKLRVVGHLPAQKLEIKVCRRTQLLRKYPFKIQWQLYVPPTLKSSTLHMAHTL